MDKVLDVLADLRSSIRDEFALVHRNVQELQQSHQDHDRSLASLSSRLDRLEQSHEPAASIDRPAKRRAQEQLPPDTAAVPSTQSTGSGSLLRPLSIATLCFHGVRAEQAILQESREDSCCPCLEILPLELSGFAPSPTLSSSNAKLPSMWMPLAYNLSVGPLGLRSMIGTPLLQRLKASLVGDAPLAWYSLVLGRRPRLGRFVQVPDALPHHMPTIAFWNSSSLCAIDVSVARARLLHLKGLLRKADVVIVCEVHPRDDWVDDLDLHGYASWISKEASNPGGAGGVLVVMSSRFARQHRAIVFPIWSGRMVQVRLEMGMCTLNVVGAHVTPIPFSFLGASCLCSAWPHRHFESF